MCSFSSPIGKFGLYKEKVKKIAFTGEKSVENVLEFFWWQISYYQIFEVDFKNKTNL